MAFDQRIKALSRRLEGLLHRLTILEGASPTRELLNGRWSDQGVNSVHESHSGPAQLEADAAASDQASLEQIQECATMSASQASPTQLRLSQELDSKGIVQHRFKRMPQDYYQRDLAYRRACLGAHSIQHLCKSIVMENTKISPEEAVQTPKYVCVLVQYSARLHAEKLKRALHKQQKDSGGLLPIKQFNMRLVPEDVSDRLTGFQHNAVTPVGSASPEMPIVMSHRIAELQPPEALMWLGGGEPDLKLGFLVADFIRAYQPWVLDCTYDD